MGFLLLNLHYLSFISTTPNSNKQLPATAMLKRDGTQPVLPQPAVKHLPLSTPNADQFVAFGIIGVTRIVASALGKPKLGIMSSVGLVRPVNKTAAWLLSAALSKRAKT